LIYECNSHKNVCDHYKIIFDYLLTHKCLLLSKNNVVNIILLQSQNLFCKTNKNFWLYLTKYLVSNPNPNTNNRIWVTRFQQPGTRFLNRVISQLTNRKTLQKNKTQYPIIPKTHSCGFKKSVFFINFANSKIVLFVLSYDYNY